MAIEKYVINHAALTDIGLKRKLNEDSLGFIEINDGYIFIVCDGMGGHEGGEIASKAAVGFIIEYLNSQKIENVSIALHQAITFANQQIFLTAKNRPDLKGMGTTVVLLLIYKDEIYTAHVGDSRIYVSTDGQFIQLTKDHSVVQDMVDNGILSSAEAENHPRKNEITKALGIREEVTPSISNKALKAKTGDRFVICSDGLSGLVSTQAFSKAVQQKNAPDECARELIALAKNGGGDDNITVQIIDITQSPFAQSFYPSQTINKAIPKAPASKKRTNTLIAAGIAGLTILGIAAGGIAYKLFFKDGSENIYKDAKSEDLKPKTFDELMQDGYLTEEDAKKQIENYLENSNQKKDPRGYIQALKKSNYKLLMDSSVLKDTVTVEDIILFKLHPKIINSIQDSPDNSADSKETKKDDIASEKKATQGTDKPVDKAKKDSPPKANVKTPVEILSEASAAREEVKKELAAANAAKIKADADATVAKDKADKEVDSKKKPDLIKKSDEAKAKQQSAEIKVKGLETKLEKAEQSVKEAEAKAK
jgi:serine/threonine protein phosphatase PrpC